MIPKYALHRTVPVNRPANSYSTIQSPRLSCGLKTTEQKGTRVGISFPTPTALLRRAERRASDCPQLTVSCSKPRLLDLFCKAGGAGMGYSLAGFEVVGVDIEPQPHFPFHFIQADALTFPLDGYDAYHASPECKGYTNCNLSPKEKYARLIGQVRERLLETGKPYIIENVVGARRDLHASLMLCGSMFDLPMERHRLFETNVFIYPPCPCDHKHTPIQIAGHSVWDSSKCGTPRKDGRKRPDSVAVSIGYQAMEIDWMNKTELSQAVPPAYTRYIGGFLMDAVMASRGMESEVD